jgi:spermidine/putrescine transport system permease protein
MTVKNYWIQKYLPFTLGSLSLVWQALFFYVPLACVILLSFTGETPLAAFKGFMSLVYVRIILRSLGMALLTSFICLIVSYPFAYFLVFHTNQLRNFFLFLVMLPFWTNFLLHICAWFFVLDRQGLLSTLLQNMGIIAGPLHILNTYWAIIIMMVYFYLPFMILPLYTALDRFDQRLLEASLDLGATWWQTVARVLIPLTMPGIRVGFLLVCIPAFGEFAIPEFMGGDRTMFVGSVIKHLILGAESEISGAAFTLLSSLVLIVVIGMLYWAIGRFIPSHYEKE